MTDVSPKSLRLLARLRYAPAKRDVDSHAPLVVRMSSTLVYFGEIWRVTPSASHIMSIHLKNKPYVDIVIAVELRPLDSIIYVLYYSPDVAVLDRLSL